MNKYKLGILYAIVTVIIIIIGYHLADKDFKITVTLIVAFITASGAIIAAYINSNKNSTDNKNQLDSRAKLQNKKTKPCPNAPCLNGINWCENRGESDLEKIVQNAKQNSKIDIFCITLEQPLKLFADENYKLLNYITGKNFEINIYTLDPNDHMASEALYWYYSYDSPKKFHSQRNNWYQNFLKIKNSLSIATSGFSLKTYTLFEGSKQILPIPNFQLYEINDQIFINPVLKITVPPPRNRVSLKNSTHITFDNSNKIANKYICDFIKTRDYYAENSNDTSD
ncbi:MAG: hypothetical protein LBM93_01500 [Oscillospiraceae bacterium]|jgi:hypothetical protein|nr:hypothetical protein [Oscillospiraceae bacterium]